MQLEKGEHSIISYFPSSTKAAKAMDELKKAGYQTMEMNRVGFYRAMPNAEYNNPINRASSLAALTMFSDGNMDKNPGILLAASPSASGLATGGELVGKKEFSVVVVTNEEDLDKAVKIIEKNDGYV